MKNFHLLFLTFLALSFNACSNDDSPQEQEKGNEVLGNFIGYEQTYSQTGDIYKTVFEEGKFLSTTINGEKKLDIEYNDADELVRITEYSNGELFTDLKYTYDESGNLAGVSEYDMESGNFKTRELIESGNKVEVKKLNTTENNSGKVVFTFENDRFSLFEDFNSNGDLLHSDDLTYDSDGNVVKNSVYTFYEGLGSVTEVFGYEYDDKKNPMEYFYQEYTLPFLIYASKQKLYSYEITTAIRAFGPNNRNKNIYPSSYSENQRLDIEVEYEGDAIKSQTFIFRPQEAVIQYLEFLYSE